MAHPKHEEVRRRYRYCCGYCGVSETSVGGELTVDHYCPISAGGDDSDENLVYAYMRCNLYKGDFWADKRRQAAGQRILHPLQEDVSEHFYENEYGELESLTLTGRTHIAILELNRPALVAYRLQQKSQLRKERLNAILQELVFAQQRTIIEMAQYIKELHERSVGNEEEREERD